MTKPKKLTIFSPENAQFSTDFRLETCFCVVLKRFEAMFWCCSNRGKELSISKIYVSILDSTFSSRTTSKILEESESKKFDPKPAIKILNENVRSNRDRNRRRHQKKESKRQQNNLHFWNKILNENSVAKNLRSPRFNLSVTLFKFIYYQRSFFDFILSCSKCKFTEWAK